MMSIRQWQSAAFENSVAKGFHSRDGKRLDPFEPDRIATRVALIHCEISEAVECVARDRMRLYFDRSSRYEGNTIYIPSGLLEAREQAVVYHFKPEGFPVELADVALRACDLAEYLGVHLREEPRMSYARRLQTPERIASALADLHGSCADILSLDDEGGWRGADELRHFFDELRAVASATNVDLLTMMELKHAYNLTRPIMHGGKVL